MSGRAFLGVFAGVDERAPGQTMLITVALPRNECGAFLDALETPHPVFGPAVAILPCLRPGRRYNDDDVLLLAALQEANRLLEAGRARLTPETLHELGVLGTLVPGGNRRRDISAPPPVALGGQ